MPYRATSAAVGAGQRVLSRGDLDGVHDDQGDAVAEILSQIVNGRDEQRNEWWDGPPLTPRSKCAFALKKRAPSRSKIGRDDMASRSDEGRARAEALFRKREQQPKNEKVWAEREAAGRAADTNRAQLKSLRLAKEAADKTAEDRKGPSKQRETKPSSSSR